MLGYREGKGAKVAEADPDVRRLGAGDGSAVHVKPAGQHESVLGVKYAGTRIPSCAHSVTEEGTA